MIILEPREFIKMLRSGKLRVATENDLDAEVYYGVEASDKVYVTD